MIRNIVERIVESTKRYIVSAGLSTDAKPIENIITGSRFLEVDTCTEYVFDEVGRSWYVLSAISAYTSENWTTDTGHDITNSQNKNIQFRVSN